MSLPDPLLLDLERAVIPASIEGVGPFGALGECNIVLTLLPEIGPRWVTAEHVLRGDPRSLFFGTRSRRSGASPYRPRVYHLVPRGGWGARENVDSMFIIPGLHDRRGGARPLLYDAVDTLQPVYAAFHPPSTHRAQYGPPVIVKGVVLRTQPSAFRWRTLTGVDETPPGSSGGAIVQVIEGHVVLVGIHLGDDHDDRSVQRATRWRPQRPQDGAFAAMGRS